MNELIHVLYAGKPIGRGQVRPQHKNKTGKVYATDASSDCMSAV